jgi:hypothetical protein
MKHVLVLLCLSVMLRAFDAEAARSSFGADLEGWTTDNTGALTWEAMGGNLGGFLQLDNDESGIAHLFAPSQFLDGLEFSDGQTLYFDGRLIAGGGSFYQAGDDYGLVRITGGGLSASADLVPSGAVPPEGSWARYITPFTAASFGVTQQEWTTILTDATEIRLTVEGLFGPEIQGMDNFCIGDFEICPFQVPTTSTSTTTTTSPSTSTSSSTIVVTTTSSSSSTSIATTTSIVSTTSTSSTTTSTLPQACELIDGDKLELRSKTGKEKRGITMQSLDGDLGIGGGVGSADDPTIHGGTLRVVSAAGDVFDDTYPLPADRWKIVKRKKEVVGYKFRKTKPIKGIDVRAGEHVRVLGDGVGFGHTLETDPDPVHVVLTIGGHCWCLYFGEDAGATVTFKPGKRWIAKGSGTGPCPGGASPEGSFVD